MNLDTIDQLSVPDAFAIVIYRRIGRDSVQPSGERPVLAEPTQLPEHLQYVKSDKCARYH